MPAALGSAAAGWAVERMDAGQVAEQDEHRHDAGQAGKVVAVKECPSKRLSAIAAAASAIASGIPFIAWNEAKVPAPHPAAQPADDAKLDIEQHLAQIERSDDYDCEATANAKRESLPGT